MEAPEENNLGKPVPKPEPRKRGRKPKPRDQTEPKPKRPRGRPRKDANQSAGNVMDLIAVICSFSLSLESGFILIVSHAIIIP